MRRGKDAHGNEPAPGCIVHAVEPVEGGLRHIEIWDSKEVRDGFSCGPRRAGCPAGSDRGWLTHMPPEPAIEELVLIDVMTGS